jgi:hypothetical protein
MDGTGRNTDPRALRSKAFVAESLGRVEEWLAPLNVTGERTPMFFVFPMSVDGACYGRLSEALGEDQAFYAFQVPSSERKPEIATSIPDIARRLIVEFENVCPQGDFILGGWSAGAIIALEMAQQLTRKGRPPALLAAIDHAPLNTGVGVNPFYPSLLNDVIRLHALWKRSRDETWKDFLPDPPAAIAKKFSSRITKFTSHAQRNLRSGNAPIGPHPIQIIIDKARTPEERELLKKLYWLLVEYKPSNFDGPVLLFLSAEHAEYEYERKWNVFAQNVTVRHFLGHVEHPTLHESFIAGEHLNLFANILKGQIDLILRRPGAPAAALTARAAVAAQLAPACHGFRYFLGRVCAPPHS